VRAVLASALVAVGAMAAPAAADVPVIDVLQLDPRSETKATTVKLVPVKDDRKTTSAGVTCAVTTGRKAEVKDPGVKPTAGAGRKTVQAYAPDLPATPTAGATGGRLARETDFQTAATVVEGVRASQGTVTANRDTYTGLSGPVGSAPTVMAAMDQNSAIRVQNGLSWGQGASAGNLWVQALNALNLVGVSARSRAAEAMHFPVAVTLSAPPTPGLGIGACAAGQIANTNPATRAAEPCLTPRYVDTDTNVAAYLAQIQAVALAAAGVRP
jgi:hypothetical protein